MKLYWLVKPDSYRSINKILGALFDDRDIRFFIKDHPKGIYITYNSEMTLDRSKWGFMPYPEYDDVDGSLYHTKNMKPSVEWLKKYVYEYRGEISRKEKLKKLDESR